MSTHTHHLHTSTWHRHYINDIPVHKQQAHTEATVAEKCLRQQNEGTRTSHKRKQINKEI